MTGMQSPSTRFHNRIDNTLNPRTNFLTRHYVVGMGLQWSDTVDPASYRSLYLLPGYLKQAQLTKHLQLVGQCP